MSCYVANIFFFAMEINGVCGLFVFVWRFYDLVFFLIRIEVVVCALFCSHHLPTYGYRILPELYR